MARESIAQLRQEAVSVAESARNAETEAKAAESAALSELEGTRERLLEAESLIMQLRQELAAAAATNAGTLTRLADARQLLAQNQEMLARGRDEHTAEREKLAERTRLAEQRFADMEKRALLDIDRERTTSAKLQKTLESERAQHVKWIDQSRAECNAVKEEVGTLREQLGALQNATVASRMSAIASSANYRRHAPGKKTPPCRSSGRGTYAAPERTGCAPLLGTHRCLKISSQPPASFRFV